MKNTLQTDPHLKVDDNLVPAQSTSSQQALQKKSEPDQQRPEVDVTLPVIKDTIEWWREWESSSSNHRRWVFESSFKAYLDAQSRMKEPKFYLVLTDTSEGVRLRSGLCNDLKEFRSSVITRFLDSPANPRYYLLLFQKGNVLLAFRKRLNPGAYLLLTQDYERVLQWYKLVDLPLEHYLREETKIFSLVADDDD